MQDYTDSERIEKENNIAFIAAKNTQSEIKEFHHTNILISLLKECTKEKLLNSRSIRRLHYQIFLVQSIGFSFVLISNYFISNYLNQLISVNVKISLMSLAIVSSFTILDLFFSPTALSIKLLYNGRFVAILSLVSQGVNFLVIILTICSITILENSWVNIYHSLSIIIIFLLTFVLVGKLKNMRSRLRVVDSNLAKAIRTASQYREHIASNFIVKTKLEIALKTAEDALENPRLYF
jgi:hypothetical protein